ncbi:MAG: hypothetical protein AB1576_03495 [Bacillota bacterium]|jgi:polyhydroxyalkanoate synthesis regulator phasin
MPYKDKAKHREYAREWARQKKVQVGSKDGKASVTSRFPNSIRLKTAEDVLDLLRQAIYDVQASDADALQRARCLAYVASTALRAVEVADLEGRVEALEKQVKAAVMRGVS